MGIRCDQFMGLPEEARKFLDDETRMVADVVCPNCQTVISTKPMCVEVDSYTGMFDDKYPLYEYELTDGRCVRERVQSDQWSSGPVFFLELVIGEGEVLYKWTEEEIANG